MGSTENEGRTHSFVQAPVAARPGAGDSNDARLQARASEAAAEVNI